MIQLILEYIRFVSLKAYVMVGVLRTGFCRATTKVFALQLAYPLQTWFIWLVQAVLITLVVLLVPCVVFGITYFVHNHMQSVNGSCSCSCLRRMYEEAKSGLEIEGPKLCCGGILGIVFFGPEILIHGFWV